jgi:2-polyprenyl-3-methyl-5-hydroxy-6-metoxy-1,4-benzoquinol methylase
MSSGTVERDAEMEPHWTVARYGLDITIELVDHAATFYQELIRMSGGNLDGFFSSFLRYRRILAARPYVRGRVLDFGCSRGALCRLAEEPNYVGVDIDESALDEARSSFPRATFVTPAELAKRPGASFDTIVALAVIEYLPDPVAFLGDMKRRLVPTGNIVLTTPNPAANRVRGAASVMGAVASDSYLAHDNALDRKKLESIARDADLQVARYGKFLFGLNQIAVLKH